MVYFILGIIVTLIVVIIVRTILFVPKKVQDNQKEEVIIDQKECVDRLAKLVECKTISYHDHNLEDDKEFEKLIKLLPKLYPTVLKKLELKRFDGRGLLFYWPGKSHKKAAVFMAHYDVVPVEEESWNTNPFKAIIKDDAMYGRGTLDTKVTFNGILSAAEMLMKEGFVPKEDIYFAFSGSEEINGIGAIEIVKYFKENNIELSMVVDEGGAVVNSIFPGVSKACGLVGIAEKGLLNVKFKVKSNGGHASAPKPHTPVGVLSSACTKLESHPFKNHFTVPVLKMFDTLGRESTFLYRMIFANLWAFGWILDLICKKSGGDLNALVRTTVAFTQMEGSKAPNVIPPYASMTANLRLNPSDSVNSAIEYIKKTIKNDDIALEILDGDDPSPISRTDCEGYEIVKEAIANTWDCLVSPYLMVQCSDSRRYGEISDKVYRFSAMDLTSEERSTIHGNNEHIRLSTVSKAVEFFVRCMKKC